MSPTAAPVVPPIRQTAASGDHSWTLRDDEFEDGGHVRRFECADCGAVRFE